MKRKAFFLIVCLVFSANLLFPVDNVMTVSDFKVESDNADYKYLGKGLSRMVEGELRKSKAVTLLERSNIKKILEEQQFSLSDLADATKQVQIGLLLSAQYIIFGEIIDLGNALLISLRMVDVETGEILWAGDITEKLETYDFIGAYFAQQILDKLGAVAPETTVAKIEKKEEKQAEAIVKLSEGIDAMDKGDKTKAKKELEEVAKLDPQNEVARYYIAMLATSSAKYRVETDIYAATYNPASLAFVEKDQVYQVTSNALYPPEANENGTIAINDCEFKEYPRSNRAGYLFPLGSRLGLALEYIDSYADMMIGVPYEIDLDGTLTSGMHPDYYIRGGSLLAGFRVTDNIALGLAFMLSYQSHATGENNFVQEGLFWGIDGGFLINLLGNRLSLDSHVIYASKKDGMIDTSDRVALFDSVPLIIDNSATLSLFNNSLFIALKGIVDVYTDHRDGYGLRLIPIIEYNPFSFVSLRAGYEYSHLDQADRFTAGWGVLGGLTVKIWKVEASANYTLRQIPSKMLPGYLLPGSTLTISSSFSGIFFN